MPDTSAQPRRRHIGLWILGGLGVGVVALVALWNWNWFLPLVNRQASAALGRPVSATGLDVHLGRVTTVVLDGIVIANAGGFDAARPFAKAGRLTVAADVMAYVHGRHIVLPQITVDTPEVDAEQKADGQANWRFAKQGSSSTPSAPDAGPQIGQLTITDGHVRLDAAKLKAKMEIDVSTRAPDAVTGAGQARAAANGGQLLAQAKGTYAGQPITGTFAGGALLSLRDAANPYPIDLHVANGPTKVSLVGTVENPLNFAGADLKLELAGPDMAQLFPLTGIPIPETPAYSIAGKLDLDGKKFNFTNFTGKLGSSDLAGDIAVDSTGSKPRVNATLTSRRVDLADLGGFIGTTPGRRDTKNQSAAQKTELERTEASSRIIPDKPINLPKVSAADVELHYRGEHIEGASVPFDTIRFNLDIKDSRIKLTPLVLGVGKGDLSLTADLEPVGKEFRTDATLAVQHVDVGRLLEATHAVHGAGSLSGNASLKSTGNSLATLLGHGDGTLKVGMSGGNVSALLVDLAGLEFGNAVLSALGIPNRASLQCFIGDFQLAHGKLETKTLLLDTSEARVQGTGSLDLMAETIDYKLKTDSKHFSVGTLDTPIDITGHLKSPSIAPEAGPLAAKAGAAVGLGILFPPAALIPTIQFGVGEDGACAQGAASVSSAVAVGVGHQPRRPALRHRG